MNCLRAGLVLTPQGRTCLELQGRKCPELELSCGRSWFRAGLVLELKFSVGVHRRRGANTLESLNTDIYSDYYFIIFFKDRLKFYTIKFSIRFFFMKCNLKFGLFFPPPLS